MSSSRLGSNHCELPIWLKFVAILYLLNHLFSFHSVGYAKCSTSIHYRSCAKGKGPTCVYSKTRKISLLVYYYLITLNKVLSKSLCLQTLSSASTELVVNSLSQKISLSYLRRRKAGGHVNHERLLCI